MNQYYIAKIGENSKERLQLGWLNAEQLHIIVQLIRAVNSNKRTEIHVLDKDMNDEFVHSWN